MAEVWAARKTGALGASQLAVVKRILPQHAADRAFLQAFIDEARLAVRLTHPNIVQVLEVGEADAEPYLALELVDGADLESVLIDLADRLRPMPRPAAARLAADILRALAHAHGLTDEAGQPLEVVHRDVSPPNILLSRTGVAKLADFGIAKAKGRLTKTSMRLLKGKTPYMSPEQARGETLDGRSDLFSLGAVLWECLTGIRLFESGDDLRNLDLVQHKPIPAPSTLRPDVEPDLDAVVLRLLARDRQARFASASEALAALEKTAAFRQSQSNDVTALAAETAKEPLARLRLPTAELALEEGATLRNLARGRRRWRAVAAAAALAALLAAWAGWRWSQTVALPPAPADDKPSGATLVVKPATTGAMFLWDGRPLGLTPLARDVAPDGKKHDAALEKPAYSSWRKSVEFKKSRTIAEKEKLTRLIGRVRAAAELPGVLTIAGRDLAAGEEMALPAGAYLARTESGKPLLVGVLPNQTTTVNLEHSTLNNPE